MLPALYLPEPPLDPQATETTAQVSHECGDQRLAQSPCGFTFVQQPQHYRIYSETLGTRVLINVQGSNFPAEPRAMPEGLHGLVVAVPNRQQLVGVGETEEEAIQNLQASLEVFLAKPTAADIAHSQVSHWWLGLGG